MTMSNRQWSKVKPLHGLTRTPVYNAWLAMVYRCTNPKAVNYPKYGGRGIGVCERWRASVVNFLADMGHPPRGYSLDRIDNAKGYESSNCRWATKRAQSLSRSDLYKFVTLDGEVICAADVADRLAIGRTTFWRRFVPRLLAAWRNA